MTPINWHSFFMGVFCTVGVEVVLVPILWLVAWIYMMNKGQPLR